MIRTHGWSMPILNHILPIVFGQTFLTSTVEHSLQGIDVKGMVFKDMFPYILQFIALQMQKGSAAFTFKMKVIVTTLRFIDELEAGAR